MGVGANNYRTCTEVSGKKRNCEEKNMWFFQNDPATTEQVQLYVDVVCSFFHGPAVVV